MIKNFSSPKIKIWFEPMFFFGFFCGFQRCGSAAFPNFRGGTSSPPQAAKCVRTNLRILHQKGNCKQEGSASLRSAANWYSILGVKTNWRFRILGEEIFLIILMYPMKKFFEKWVLIPLDFVLIIWAIKEFLSKNWVTGIILILASFIIGIIGQSFHKDKTAHQLMRGEHLLEIDKEK